MTQPSQKYKSLLFSDKGNDQKAFDLLNKLEILHELTNYKADPCLYNHGFSCSQCGITTSIRHLAELGYSEGSADRIFQKLFTKEQIFFALCGIEKEMETHKKKVYANWRESDQYFPDEAIIFEDLVLEV